MKLEEINKKFSIMQGRLTKSPNNILDWFPFETWRNEFEIASEIGISNIELVFDKDRNINNPIWSLSSLNELFNIASKFKIQCNFACFNYMINNSIFHEKHKLILYDSLSRARSFGINNFVLPFFEKSELVNLNLIKIRNLFIELNQFSCKNDLRLHIETNLEASVIVKIIRSYNLNNIFFLVDTGNYISNNFDIISDIINFHEFIKHIHIKDKNVNGSNVLLGRGKADFYDINVALNSIKYNGLYTFETYRGNDPIETAKFHTNFVKFFIKESINDYS